MDGQQQHIAIQRAVRGLLFYTTLLSFCHWLNDIYTAPLELFLAREHFLRQTKKMSPEQAGIFFEVRCLRDRLLFGEDCADILGPAFLRYIENNGFSSFSADDSDVENLDVDDWLDAKENNYFKYLKYLDPTTWRDQDHYKVFGLTRLSFKATESQIKIAYRKKVLPYHPYKRRHQGLVVKTVEEDYFMCIFKAYETLSNNQKRRAYEFSDPLFDNSVSSTATKQNFYKVFGPVFDRWSRKNHVPQFGNDQTPIDEVDRFYKFWFDFDSWREFSYLDEEDKEKGENRDDRRWIDKQNKAMRDKRRKDEVLRIRNFVDNAYKCDPRIQKHKDSQKINFFAPVDDESTRFVNMADLDRPGQTLPLEKLKDLNVKLNQATNGTKTSDAFRRFVDDFNSQVELEKRKSLEKLENSSGKGADAQFNEQFSNCNLTVGKNHLIKAMTLFPVSVKSWWDVIAAFINKHIKAASFFTFVLGKDVVFKVKELQRLDDKTQENSAKALPLLQDKSNLQVLEPPSVRTESPVDANSDGNPWTSEEQKRLEQALRSLGADDPEIWGRIAGSESCLAGPKKTTLNVVKKLPNWCALEKEPWNNKSDE